MSEDKNIQDNQEKISNEKQLEEVTEQKDENIIVEENFTKEKKNLNINAKTVIIAGIVGLLCLGGGYALGKEAGRELPATAKNYSNSKVLATVGDVKITGEQMEKKMEPLFYLKGKTALTEDEILAYESSFIDYMTTTEVLYLAGIEEKVDVSNEEVEKEYKNLMTSISSKFAMSEEDFLKKFSLTPEYIKEETKKELIASKYISKASEVSEKDAQTYYDKNKDEFLQVQASHILIKNMNDEGKPVSDEEKESNRVKAEEILEKAKSGVDFSELAKEYSQDTSAKNGGDLGLFGKGQMVEPFEEAAFALEVGGISDKLVETDYGYHIIKKTSEEYQNFEDIKAELLNTLSYEKQGKLIEDLTKKYNVTVK